MQSNRFIDIYNNAVEQTSFEENYFVKKFAAYSDFKKDVVRSAHEYHIELPEKFDKVIVINVSDVQERKAEVLYISPLAVKALRKKIGPCQTELENLSIINQITNNIMTDFDYNYDGAKAIAFSEYSKTFNSVIALNENYTIRESKKKYARDTKGDFEHECGHKVTEGGFPNGDLYSHHYAECSAEALNLIEHYAENKNDDSYIKQNDCFECSILEDSPEHYINVINYAVRNLSAKYDLALLNPRQKVVLAEMVAEIYALKEHELEPIFSAFTPLAEEYDPNKPVNQIMTNCCMDIMRNNLNNHDIFRAGNEFIQNTSHDEALKTNIKNLAAKQGIELDLAKAQEDKSDNIIPFIDSVKYEFPILDEETTYNNCSLII